MRVILYTVFHKDKVLRNRSIFFNAPVCTSFKFFFVNSHSLESTCVLKSREIFVLPDSSFSVAWLLLNQRKFVISIKFTWVGVFHWIFVKFFYNSFYTELMVSYGIWTLLLILEVENITFGFPANHVTDAKFNLFEV